MKRRIMLSSCCAIIPRFFPGIFFLYLAPALYYICEEHLKSRLFLHFSVANHFIFEFFPSLDCFGGGTGATLVPDG